MLWEVLRDDLRLLPFLLLSLSPIIARYLGWNRLPIQVDHFAWVFVILFGGFIAVSPSVLVVHWLWQRDSRRRAAEEYHRRCGK